jgi:hypothetical protein
LPDIFSHFVRKYLKQSLMAGIAMSVVLYISSAIFKVSALASKKDLLISLSLHIGLSLLVYILILFVFFKNGMIKFFAEKISGKT